MSVTTKWIVDVMEAWAPSKWAMESDNVGLLVGDRARPVTRILTALDLSEDVLVEAVKGQFDIVVAHHPLINRRVQPINSITTDNVLGKKIMTLIGNGIGLFCAHTNLDVAPGGVNDLLFSMLDLKDKEHLVAPKNPDSPTLGLIGYLQQPMSLIAMVEHVGKVLNLERVRYVGKEDMQVSKVGICGGNGTDPALVKSAIEKKCNAYITGDIGYHLGMEALEYGMGLIDGTHYGTEFPIAKVIADHLKKAAETQGYDLTIEMTKSDGQVFRST